MLQEEVINHLISEKGDIPFVVLMCGIAGSGKTTFSKKLEEEGFIRLSIDEEVWSTYGRYGVDYPREKYREYLDESHARICDKLLKFIQENKKIVLDSSFWSRSEREKYKQLIEENGGKWKLIYLKVDDNELRRRLEIRSKRFDANAAFPITKEMLTTFLKGFEEPIGEGEIVI
ncbi:AAA family ATPase [Paucisalibacillus globulus]|jgi:predicted kinase|uniref:AAA family ATPase n=1 Tax=Paucisalibacillus globulus TaxID=351095 RepID=UPI0003F77DA1|nr:ATP-binding protein [Paucisalibacillus globulus]